MEENKNNRFVAIDFETLEYWRASVIAIGVAVIENNKIVDSFYTEVCPPSKNESYHCVQTHGLHYDDVKNNPMFDELWNMIDEKYIKGSPIISHNIGFEKSCINECSDYFGTNNHYVYYDTINLSKKYIKGLDNYQLDTISEHLNYNLKKHHNALEDALACAYIFAYLNKKHPNMIEEYGRKGDRK